MKGVDHRYHLLQLLDPEVKELFLQRGEWVSSSSFKSVAAIYIDRYLGPLKASGPDYQPFWRKSWINPQRDGGTMQRCYSVMSRNRVNVMVGGEAPRVAHAYWSF